MTTRILPVPTTGAIAPDARGIAARFAKVGIYALYGGSKGYGFWLYCGTREEFFEMERASRPNMPNIENDGSQSGNPHFWMWPQAVQLLEQIEAAPQKDYVITPEQTARYRDVLVTIREGGSAHWAAFRNTVRSRGRDWHYVSFEMRDCCAGVSATRSEVPTDNWQICDAQTVARGIRLILDGEVKANLTVVGACAELWADPENADDDAEIADCIAQAGLYNDIIFG